jgi:DNA-binding beta-propeller fold protein YncE
VCAVDASTLARGSCVTIPASPDGVAYVASTHEVWVTTPRTKSIYILDVTTPSGPKLAGNFTLEGEPEGYAVDETHGVFYTNLEDKDRTLRIDIKTRKVTSTWLPACGEDGPKGLAIEPAEQLLVAACPDHVEVIDAGKDGKILSKLDTGAGVDIGGAIVPVAQVTPKVCSESMDRPTAVRVSIECESIETARYQGNRCGLWAFSGGRPA